MSPPRSVSVRKTRQSSRKRSPFLDLPAEIRLMIYRLLDDSTDEAPRVQIWPDDWDRSIRSPELRKIEASASNIVTSSPGKYGIVAAFPSELKSLMPLLKVSRQIRAESMPIIHRRLIVDAVEFGDGCWYGLTSPWFTAHVRELYLTEEPQSEMMLRWMRQIIRFYPDLRTLTLYEVGARKDRSAYGSLWARRKLYAMRYILKHSHLNAIHIEEEQFPDDDDNYQLPTLIFKAYNAAELAVAQKRPDYLDPERELARADAHRAAKRLKVTK